ncbi:MAG: hypothetical protein PHS14_14075 [Elusimicrobia bacterium]|nr:hypothetical protein [Elusimicrobiota bacterium]
MKHSIAVVALALSMAFPLAAEESRNKAPPAGEAPETARLYQAGLAFYARGDLAAALASFREVARLDSNDRSALAAVRRLESELAARTTAGRPLPSGSSRRASSSRLERFLLVSVPRWFHFERTVGDPMNDVGTLTALNARVVQLLGERRFALAQKRPFRNDRQLRALLRRAPAATQHYEEV